MPNLLQNLDTRQQFIKRTIAFKVEQIYEDCDMKNTTTFCANLKLQYAGQASGSMRPKTIRSASPSPPSTRSATVCKPSNSQVTTSKQVTVALVVL